MVAALERAGVSTMHITVHSDKGHDSFLLEPQLYTPHLVYTLEGRWKNGQLEEEPALMVE